MSNRIKIVILWLLLIGGCSRDTVVGESVPVLSGVTYNSDGTMNVRLCLEVPEMLSATRAVLGEEPDFNGSAYKLYMLVFEQGRGLGQYVIMDVPSEEPEVSPGQHDDKHGHENLLTFNTTLNPTEWPATIHLILTNQEDFDKQLVYGTEERVIPTLYTKDGYEAYWQRIAFGYYIPSQEQLQEKLSDGTPNKKYNKEDADHAKEIADLMAHIPMVRNFCRVSLAGSPENFTVTGMYVVNTVDRGSVAPYVAGRESGDRFVAYCERNSDGSYAGKSYDDISAFGHVGTLPSGVTLINTELDPSKLATKSEGSKIDPIYFYERPARVNSTERTYVVIKGKYTGAGASNPVKETYYKIDLGKLDEETTGNETGDPSHGEDNNEVIGLFSYYNLLRNFDYQITIKSVESDGYEKLSDAARGAVYNNFSAAVEARTMKSISDGDDMIFVNYTSFVFTRNNQTFDLEAQYREDITINDGTVRNDLLKVKWEKGEVIDNLTGPTSKTGADGKAWNVYKVDGTDPTNDLRQQTVYVYRGNKKGPNEEPEYGLYRVITFFSHVPWDFDHMDTFPGLWPDINDMPDWNWSDELREVGETKGSALTLFFELPGGLPQALFPLDFVIESDRQNIQNAYAGNAVVRSVQASESLFSNDQPLPYKKNKDDTEYAKAKKPTTTRIQYVKTVTWEDYFGGLSEELVGHGSSIVRCRFLTITDLNQDVIGDTDNEGTTGDSKSITTIRVSNEYFDTILTKDNGDPIYNSNGEIQYKYHQDGFERYTRTSDPTPGLWNFSDYVWSTIIEELKSGNPAGYPKDDSNWNNKSGNDGLMVETTGVNQLSSGTIEITEGTEADGTLTTTTYNYLRTTSSDVTFTHTRKYPGTDERSIGVRIVSTDDNDNGTPVAPKVKLTITKNSGSTEEDMVYQKNEDDTPKLDETTVPFASYVFVREGVDMTNVASVTVKITPPSNAATRFYKIEFYPRWGDFTASDSGSGSDSGN